MSVVRVNQVQDTSTNVAANVSGGVVTFSNRIIQPAKIAFKAGKTDGNQSISNSSLTQVTFSHTVLNDGSCYSTGNSRFTPNVAGNYFLYTALQLTGTFGDNATYYITIRKNGSVEVYNENKVWEGGSFSLTRNVSSLSTANGSSDYFDVAVFVNGSGTPPVRNGTAFTQFGGYLI